MPQEKEKIVINCDGVKVYGPKVDGSFSITFETGEYEQISVAKILTIPQNESIRVTIELEES